MKLTVTLFLLISLSAAGQTPLQRTFGDVSDEYAFAVKKTSDKGYVVGGYTSSFLAAQYDFYLVKTDSNGTAVWGKTYGSNKRDQMFSLITTSDGGYLAGGYSNSIRSVGGYDGMVVKTDANGDTLWAWLYGGTQDDFINTMQQTSDGGYIFAGYTTPKLFTHDSGNVLLVKTNSTGLIQWSKVIGAPLLYTDGYGIIQTSDKGFLITGYTDGFGEAAGDVFLFKTDSSGNVSWGKTYGFKGVDWAYSVLPAGNGFIIGATYSTDSTSTDADALLIRTDSAGDTLWTKCYGSVGYDYVQRLLASQAGGYLAVGYSNSFGSSFDAFALRVDVNGDTLYTDAYGDAGDDEFNDAADANGQGFMLAGQESSFGLGSYDFYLVKTDSAGNAGCYGRRVYPSRRSCTVQVNPVTPLQAALPLQRNFTGLNGVSLVNSFDPCNPNGVHSIMTEEVITIYPNPGAGVFVLDAPFGNAHVSVRNALGEIVYQSEATHFPMEISLPDVRAGVYFIELRSEGETVHTRKLLVEK